MQSLGNLYIEPNQIRDERKSSALSKKIADLGCIDENTMQIIVQRVETSNTQNAGKSSASHNPAVFQKLQSVRSPELQTAIKEKLVSANNDINFSNFDQCYRHVCDAIHLLEQNH
jgi:hypothetical protein